LLLARADREIGDAVEIHVACEDRGDSDIFRSVEEQMNSCV
jgi:hypothetical protein